MTGESRHARTNGDTWLIPSKTQDAHDREPEGGEEHPQMVAPLEELNGGQREVETTDVDYTRAVSSIKKRYSDRGIPG